MKSKPKLAVDVDETIVYLLRYFLDYYNDKHGTSFSEEDFSSYRWWEILKITKKQAYEEAEEYIKDHMSIFENGLPRGLFEIHLLPGAEQALDLLYRFYDLYAITDRNPLFDQDTFNLSSWLYIEEGDGTYFPYLKIEEGAALVLPWHRFHSTGGEKTTKADVCKRLGIELLIDDNPDVAYECAKEGIRTIMLAKPWNKDVEHSLITKVQDWQGVCDCLVGGIKLPYLEKDDYI